MGNKVEKSFEERLNSLKKGCVILGILQAISVYSSIKDLIDVIEIDVLYILAKVA